MQPENELVRKAAGEIWKAIGDGPPDPKDSFDGLAPEVQKDFMRMAEAALKVFYDYTQAQTRERIPPACVDCGSVMTPAQSGWACGSCGASR